VFLSFGENILTRDCLCLSESDNLILDLVDNLEVAEGLTALFLEIEDVDFFINFLDFDGEFNGDLIAVDSLELDLEIFIRRFSFLGEITVFLK
jgi:hypothetical protein